MQLRGRRGAADSAGDPGLGHTGRERGDGRAALPGRARAAAGLRRGGSASAPGAARSVAAASVNRYGPVVGHVSLRQAAARYWARRGLATGPGQVVRGPGSKPLLFALLLAIGGAVALPRPSWVSYAAQAAMIGARAHLMPAAPGEGGICDPADRPIRSVLVTLPDNPTGRLASPATVGALCEVAAAHGLIIICDEIYRDLVHDPATPLLSPAQAAPDRTVITTGLSKSLALGGWRIGVPGCPPARSATGCAAHCSASAARSGPRPPRRSSTAAALAFAEPPLIAARVAASPALRAATAGLAVALPQGGFYVYPDFEPWREHLARRHQVTTAAGLAKLLLHRYGAATLPGSAFGEPRASCGCGWPPACCTATAPSSSRQRLPPPTPRRSRGSPPRWPGSARYSPTWPTQPQPRPLPGQAPPPPPGHRCPDQCRTSALQVNCPGKRRRSDNDQQLTAVGVMLLRHRCGSPGPAVERMYEPQFGEGFGQPVPVVEVTAQR